MYFKQNLKKYLSEYHSKFDISLLDNIGKSSEYFIRLTTYFPVFMQNALDGQWTVLSEAGMKIK